MNNYSELGDLNNLPKGMEIPENVKEPELTGDILKAMFKSHLEKILEEKKYIIMDYNINQDNDKPLEIILRLHLKEG